MLTADEIFHVSSDGVKLQGEGDKEQGYNHQFVPLVLSAVVITGLWEMKSYPRCSPKVGGQWLQITGAL